MPQNKRHQVELSASPLNHFAGTFCVCGHTKQSIEKSNIRETETETETETEIETELGLIWCIHNGRGLVLDWRSKQTIQRKID